MPPPDQPPTHPWAPDPLPTKPEEVAEALDEAYSRGFDAGVAWAARRIRAAQSEALHPIGREGAR